MWTFISHFRDDPPDGHETGRHADEEEEEESVKVKTEFRLLLQQVQWLLAARAGDPVMWPVFVLCLHVLQTHGPWTHHRVETHSSFLYFFNYSDFLLFLELNSSNMESAGKKTVVPAEIYSDNDFVLCQLLLESRCDVEIKSLLYKR